MLTKNTDLDKYKYRGFGIGFDSHLEFSFTDGSMGKNVIIFGGDMRTHLCILIIKIKMSYFLTLAAEANYPINFIPPRKRFVLSIHYNRSNSFVFVNATEVYQFKAKDTKIKNFTLCIGNISKDFIIWYEKTGLKESIKCFSVDFNSVNTTVILEIQKYLMKKS